jgi:hypothetical protein
MRVAIGAASVLAAVSAGLGLAAGISADQPAAPGRPTQRDTTAVWPAEPTQAPPSKPSSESTATAEEPPEPGLGPLDWDGGRWDVGNVVSINRDADRLVVILDRYQMYQNELGSDEYSLRAGKRLLREPFVVGNSDTPFVNDSSKLRRYELAADAKVEWISNVDKICTSLRGDKNNDGVSDSRQKPAPKFERRNVDRLVEDSLHTEDLNGSGAEYDARQDVLTFNDSGQVVRLVFSRGC